MSQSRDDVEARPAKRRKTEEFDVALSGGTSQKQKDLKGKVVKQQGDEVISNNDENKAEVKAQQDEEDSGDSSGVKEQGPQDSESEAAQKKGMIKTTPHHNRMPLIAKQQATAMRRRWWNCQRRMKSGGSRTRTSRFARRITRSLECTRASCLITPRS